MATAQIKINSVSGSNVALPLNTLVTLSNNDNTGVLTWEWTILSQPAGTADVLSSLSTSTTSFTPKKEGSYLIRLVVNKGLAGESTNQVVAAVKELETLTRIPAAGETIEVDSDNGWANAAVSSILQRVTRLTDNGVMVGQASTALTAFDVVKISDTATLASGLPGQRKVPVFAKALATDLQAMNEALAVVISGVDGTGSVSSGALARASVLGIISGVNLTTAGQAVGTPVYVSDTARLSFTAGTNSRHLATVAKETSAGIYDLLVAGTMLESAGGATGAAGGILGYPGSTYPNPNGLSALVTGEIPIAPYTGQSYVYVVGDASSTGIGTSLSFVAGASTAPVGNGGAFELAGGNSTNATGGALSLFGGHGPTGGALSIYAGNSSSGVGGATTVAAGSSSTTTGGALTLRGGSSTSASAGVAGGAVNIRGGTNSNAGTLGGAVDIQGGTGGTNTGAQLLLGGGVGTVGAFKTGSATLKAFDAPAAGSGGDVTIQSGSGGSGGNAGNIAITAGNSTQNNTTADGGSITLTAGNNTTVNGEGGDVVLKGGLNAGVGATASQLTVYGGEASYPGGNIDLSAGTTGTQGRYVVLKGGNGTVTNGSVIIGPGSGAGATGGVYIAYAGVSPGPAAGNVFLGSDTYTNTVKGNTAIGTSASTNSIQGTTSIGGTSQVTTHKGAVVIGDSGTTTTRLVLSPTTYAFATNGIVTGATIPVTSPNIRVIPTLGAVDQQSVPSLDTTGIPEGTRVIIVNGHAATVTFNSDPHVAGTKLKLGANSRVIPQYGVLELQYMKDSSNNYYWTEVGFRG